MDNIKQDDRVLPSNVRLLLNRKELERLYKALEGDTAPRTALCVTKCRERRGLVWARVYFEHCNIDFIKRTVYAIQSNS